MDVKDIKAEAANPTENVGNPAEELRQQGDTQPTAEPSQLDNLRNMMSSRYPEQQFGSDDDIYAKIADDYQTHDKELGEYKDREGRMAKLFQRDERSAQFLHDWIDGGDPMIAMIKRYGDDFKAALDDPDKAEEIAAANKEYVDGLAKERQLEDEYKKNLQTSIDAIDKYQSENGLSDDDVDKALAYLTKAAHKIIMGQIDPDMIKAALKAQNYDADIEDAAHEAEVRGKNARVEEQLRKPKATDGMPQLGSRGTGNNAPQRPNIAGALGRTKESIWDKGGGIKRTQR